MRLKMWKKLVGLKLRIYVGWQTNSCRSSLGPFSLLRLIQVVKGYGACGQETHHLTLQWLAPAHPVARVHCFNCHHLYPVGYCTAGSFSINNMNATCPTSWFCETIWSSHLKSFLLYFVFQASLKEMRVLHSKFTHEWNEMNEWNEIISWGIKIVVAIFENPCNQFFFFSIFIYRSNHNEITHLCSFYCILMLSPCVYRTMSCPWVDTCIFHRVFPPSVGSYKLTFSDCDSLAV